jgi:hypothetical protein
MRSRAPWALLPLAVACGSTGGQIAGKIGSAVADAASRSSSSTPERVPWSTSRGRCGVFSDYQMACPVLADCHGLPRDDTPTLNACYSGSGILKPVRVCTDWNNNPYWCASGHFPPCSRLEGASCGTFETMVCDGGDGKLRVVQCCPAASSEGCASNTYYEPRKREAIADAAAAAPPAASQDAPEGDAGGRVDAE